MVKTRLRMPFNADNPDYLCNTLKLTDWTGNYLGCCPYRRRIQRLRDEGLIQDQVVTLDRKKAGLNALIFAQVKLSSQGRSNLAEFSDAIRGFPEVLDCYVLLGNVDFLLRIVAEDIEAYEKFFFEKLSTLSGVQEITSSIALSEIKHTTALPL